MLRGMATVTYFAAALNAARRWYSDLLGVEAYFEQPGNVEFRVGDYQQELGLIDSRYAPGGAGQSTVGAAQASSRSITANTSSTCPRCSAHWPPPSRRRRRWNGEAGSPSPGTITAPPSPGRSTLGRRGRGEVRVDAPGQGTSCHSSRGLAWWHGSVVLPARFARMERRRRVRHGRQGARCLRSAALQSTSISQRNEVCHALRPFPPHVRCDRRAVRAARPARAARGALERIHTCTRSCRPTDGA